LRRKLRKVVHLRKAASPGPCALANVASLMLDGRAIWFHSVDSPRVHVSRWRCRHAQCQRQVFTERLAGVCVPHARHTMRFADVLQLVGYALGGRGGERLPGHLGMPAQ